MRYGVILMGYKRNKALLEAARLVLFQEPSPIRLVVWHNAPSLVTVPDFHNIYSDINIGCSARHLIYGLFAGLDAVVFLDDDILMRKRLVCATLVEHLLRETHPLVGYHGRKINTGNKPYSTELDVTEPGPVDVVKGFLCATKPEFLKYVWDFALTPELRMEDDIILSGTTQIVFNKPGCIVEMPARAVEMVYYPNGNLSRPDHMQRRDAACLEMLKRGWKPLCTQKG